MLDDYSESGGTYTTKPLTRIKFGWQQFVSEQLADDFAIEPRADVYHDTFGGLRFSVTQNVFAENLDKRSARYPTTWRDAVKVAFYVWLDIHWPWGAEIGRARWPAEYTTVEIAAAILYPKVRSPDTYPTIIRATWQDRE